MKNNVRGLMVVVLMTVASAGIYGQEGEELPVPIIKTPENGVTIGDSTIEFSWHIVEGVSRYGIQIALDEEFTMLELNTSTPNYDYTSYTWRAAAKDGTKYYWRIRASFPSGSGPWTETRWFISDLVLPAPKLQYPNNGATVKSNYINCSWEGNIDARGGHIQVSENDTFAVNIICLRRSRSEAGGGPKVKHPFLLL